MFAGGQFAAYRAHSKTSKNNTGSLGMAMEKRAGKRKMKAYFLIYRPGKEAHKKFGVVDRLRF